MVSLAKWRILNRLHDRNETLYYKVNAIRAKYAYSTKAYLLPSQWLLYLLLVWVHPSTHPSTFVCGVGYESIFWYRRVWDAQCHLTSLNPNILVPSAQVLIDNIEKFAPIIYTLLLESILQYINTKVCVGELRVYCVWWYHTVGEWQCHLTFSTPIGLVPSKQVLIDNIEEFAPIIYTPTIGLVCQRYSGLFRRPRGMYFTAKDRGEMMSMIYNWPAEQVTIYC